MSDTTTILILDTYLVYLNTGDQEFVQATWPHLVRAAQWQINRTIEGGGFPHHLQNTYDYLGLEQSVRTLPAFPLTYIHIDCRGLSMTDCRLRSGTRTHHIRASSTLHQ